MPHPIQISATGWALYTVPLRGTLGVTTCKIKLRLGTLLQAQYIQNTILLTKNLIAKLGMWGDPYPKSWINQDVRVSPAADTCLLASSRGSGLEQQAALWLQPRIWRRCNCFSEKQGMTKENTQISTLSTTSLLLGVKRPGLRLAAPHTARKSKSQRERNEIKTTWEQHDRWHSQTWEQYHYYKDNKCTLICITSPFFFFFSMDRSTLVAPSSKLPPAAAHCTSFTDTYLNFWWLIKLLREACRQLSDPRPSQPT